MSASPGTGPLIDPRRLPFLEVISRLYRTCPFDPAWEELERTAMGIGGNGKGLTDGGEITENLKRMSEPIGMGLAVIAGALARGAAGTDHELAVYRGAALYGLFAEYGAELQRLIDEDGVAVPFYDAFLESYRFLFRHRGIVVPEPSRLLEIFYQARRAWYFASTKIVGGSPSARASRVAVWRANLPADVCAYAVGFYRRMAVLPVLITGETGTGKEIAASCIGWGRYIPFDVGGRRFLKRPREDFHTRNLSEASEGLFESMLFGHKRGAFTGATSDSPGFFGLAQAYGSLLLDEMGELARPSQVKLLRPLESRRYTRVGDVHEREILCRIMFATHRDLDAMVRAGTFREDLFQRMNVVRVHMPPLRQMLAEAPGDLRAYVRAFVAGSDIQPEQVESVTESVVAAVGAKRPGHFWPGNLRELRGYTDRCLVGEAEPPPPAAPAQVTTAPASPPTRPPPSAGVPSSYGRLLERAKAGEATLEEVDRATVTWAYAVAGQNESETARRMEIDRRKVNRLVDVSRLVRWLKYLK